MRQGAICATLCDSNAHHHLKTHEALSIKHMQRFRLMWVGLLHRLKRPLIWYFVCPLQQIIDITPPLAVAKIHNSRQSVSLDSLSGIDLRQLDCNGKVCHGYGCDTTFFCLKRLNFILTLNMIGGLG